MKPKPTRLDSKPCQRDHRHFAELRSARLENKSRAEPTVQAKTLRRETRKAIMLQCKLRQRLRFGRKHRSRSKRHGSYTKAAWGWQLKGPGERNVGCAVTVGRGG